MPKIVLLLVSCLSLLAASAFADDWSKTYTVGEKPSLRVDTNDAAVEVTRGSSNTIAAHVVSDGYKRGDIRVTERQDGDKVEMTVHLPNESGFHISMHPRRARVELQVPAETMLDLHSGDGHINAINVNHALYWAVGHDTLNPLANQAQNISALMAALELSYDQDWLRFRISGFYSSGDHDIKNGHANGFDSIMDNPQFAGGEFSYWQRQQLRLFGVNLQQQRSLIPDLRSSKTQGQTNFVNPGLFLINLGVDAEITPKWRLINNANGTVSLQATVNNRYVAAENAGAAPLIANRDAIGPWEQFDLITL